MARDPLMERSIESPIMHIMSIAFRVAADICPPNWDDLMRWSDETILGWSMTDVPDRTNKRCVRRRLAHC